jgi:hypothetical protein
VRQSTEIILLTDAQDKITKGLVSNAYRGYEPLISMGGVSWNGFATLPSDRVRSLSELTIA